MTEPWQRLCVVVKNQLIWLCEVERCLAKVKSEENLSRPGARFPQSGHALQWGLVPGPDVRSPRGSAGWMGRGPALPELDIPTVSVNGPVFDPVEFYSRAPTRSPLMRTRRV